MSNDDYLEIQRLNYLYAYHVDVFDIESWVDVFTHDAFFDEREFGAGLFIGHAQIRDYGLSLAKTTVHWVHLMTNHVVWDLQPLHARGTVFAIVEVLAHSGDHIRNHVIYEDDYVRTSGAWKIAKRVLRKTFPVEVLASSKTTS